MTPTPQESQQCTGSEEGPGLTSESIVISGMSGLFPLSHNVKEFSDILYSKVNPISSDNKPWKWVHPEAPGFIGKVPDLQRFDSRFFMVHHHLALRMDPMARKLLEQSYQAIYDAGVSPKDLKGKKVGVYIASSLSDTERTGATDTVSRTGFGITGCSKTMYANRISYWLDSKGPSVSIDNACCGFTVALEEAVGAINQGICEAAIVGAAHISLFPQAQVHYSRCIKTSPDGTTKCFDKDANGCANSEAIGVVFLQKAKDALRSYAELVHVKNAFISRLTVEGNQVFGFVRDPDVTAEFLKQFYNEAGTRPQTVEYVEAFGSATPDADKAELQAVEKVFCKNRTDTLFVGSVISNIGYTEASSGAVALTKVLLGYHNGLLASNLHCDSPRQDVAAIRDGSMRIVTNHMPFDRKGALAGINCLSITGVNSHVLLRGCSKTKVRGQYQTSIPRLVNVSARLEKHLEHVFQDLKSHPIDPEELALLHNIHSTNISGHLGRGYIILDTNDDSKTVSLSEKMEHSDESKRPLWFVYSGMGSQWNCMGAQLMRIPIFAAAIERCHKVLEPKGVDLLHVITSPNKEIFDNILNSFVGITAIQIGLTDVLTAMGLNPDNIIGHSVGELGCAYVDGCLTAEETILSAYGRGVVSNETVLIRGAMAAVGLGHEQLLKLCPPEIEIACHNSKESSTISGPEANIKEFVASLVAKGIFAKEVQTSNIAYHSRYIADAGPSLRRILSDLIKEPRRRSERWLSTSVQQERWDDPSTQYCSADYLTNNLLSSVYFQETSKLIPSNAVLVEIAPHGLLQAIVTRSLPKSCLNVPLTQRGHNDNALFLLEAIGKLYTAGFTPRIQELYPKVEFPVSRGTPHLSHLVKWNHAEIWMAVADLQTDKTTSMCSHLVTTYDDEYSYLTGNIINGRMQYPFAAALVAVWDTLAMCLEKPKKSFSVQFDDVQLYSQPIIKSDTSMSLRVCLHRGNGMFEVLNGISNVATGYIKILPKESPILQVTKIRNDLLITSEEIYKHLGSRGYTYRDVFRSVHSVDESLCVAQLIWKNNWVTLIDGMIQLNALRHAYGGVTQPTYFRRMTIDTEAHAQLTGNSDSYIDVEVDDCLDCTRCGSIILNNIIFRNISLINQHAMELIPVFPKKDNISVLSNKKLAAAKDIALVIGNVGDLDTLQWEEAPVASGHGVRVLVEYAGVNITDINRATKGSQFDEDEKYFGMDFSGITDGGERVMGVVRHGAARSVVRACDTLLWPVPAHWSLEEAATVPLAYLQAYYCLCIKSDLKSGSRVLVHGGTGALGQAVISIALAHGCQVFATVANTIKKRYLLKLFPQLHENMIGNSRDGSFGDMVLNSTNGAGCQIVISCTNGNLKDVTLNCSAFFGVTLDTVQLQNREKYEYGMSYMTKSRSYIAVEFYSIFDSKNNALQKKLQLLLSSGIASGEVRPLSRVTYAASEAPQAFRLVAASQHRGRVLLRLRDACSVLGTRAVFSADNSNLIIWDGSSFGLQFADRLISRGVRKLRIQYINSMPNYHNIKLRLWKKLGIDVQILSVNLNYNYAVSAVINEANQCGAVEGIYVIAAENTDVNEVARIIGQLDTASRKLCPHLKYFEVITSDGNIAQEICARSKDGYPATAVTLSSKNDESSCNRYAVDAAEAALGSDFPIQVARQLSTQKTSLARLIPALSGSDNQESTLQDLSLSESVPLIKLYLNDVCQIYLDDEKILKLTKKRILELETLKSDCISKEKKGLHTFFSYIERDELLATVSFIPLDTIVNKVKSMEDGIDVTKTYLFVIPGLEGQHCRFRTLCKHLKVSVIVLQPDLDLPNATPAEQARRYSKILLENFKLKNNFYLMAYECGIFTALEVVAILEDNGLTGALYCVGDGPEETLALLEEELTVFGKEKDVQASIARHMFSLFAEGTVPIPSLECETWDARVDACVNALRGRVSLSAQYMRALLQAAYRRICAVRQHTPQQRELSSRLMLLRACQSSQTANSLQRYSSKPLQICELSTTMEHAADDLRVPAFINSMLDKQILDIYNNMNLCDTYTLI